MKNIIYIVLLASIFGCEQVIDLDIPPHEPELVMSGFYQDGDDSLVVFVSNSIGILEDKDNIETPVDAVVQLFEDGQLHSTLQYENTFQGDRFKANFATPLQADKSYRLVASNEGFPVASSTVTFPNQVPILSMSYESEGGRDEEGEVRDEVIIDFADPADEENYYEIRVFAVDRSTGIAYRWYYRSLDPIVQRGYNFNLLEDQPFGGETYSLRILMNKIDFGTTGVRVELHTVSRDYFLYSKSLYAKDIAGDNPFAEPVIIHTNVEDGQGIFAINNFSFYEL